MADSEEKHAKSITKAAKPTRTLFDPWNSSSTGHQRAENRLAGSTSWRDSRTRKLREQFNDRTGGGGARVADSVGAGSEDFGKDGRLENGGWVRGAPGLRGDGQPSLQDSFKDPSAAAAKSSWSLGDAARIKRRKIDSPAALRTDKPQHGQGVLDPRQDPSINMQKVITNEHHPAARLQALEPLSTLVQQRGAATTRQTDRSLHTKPASDAGSRSRSTTQAPDTTVPDTTVPDSSSTKSQALKPTSTPAQQPNSTPSQTKLSQNSNMTSSASTVTTDAGFSPATRNTPNDLPADRMRPLDEPATSASSPKQIFQGLTFYINGSTYPLISDHRLKQLIGQHGGSLCLGLARRSVTHVIVGETSRNGGSGRGLAGSKVQKEAALGSRGEDVRYIKPAWIVESVKQRKRVSEASFQVEGLGTGGARQNTVLNMFKSAGKGL